MKRDEALTLATMWMDPKNTMLSERSRQTDTRWDSTDGKRPDQEDPQTQRVGSWLSGAREGVKMTAYWGFNDNVLMTMF